MWAFCLHSLLRQYGWQFLRHVAAPHFLRTTRAVLKSGALDFSGDTLTTSNEAPDSNLEDAPSIVGVGFCLKPMNPPCPSGRPNHDCLYLERLLHSGVSDAPVCCRQCAIREIGVLSLQAGSAFCVMTSARDILFDLFVPALEEERFASGLFVLCRYSFQPFAVGLLASGIRGRLFAFERGDCRDYRTWLQADRGIKDEQTAINRPNRKTIGELLGNVTKEPTAYKQFERRGNVLYPRTAADDSRQAANVPPRIEKTDRRGTRTGP